MPICWHCKAESSVAHYDRITHNKHALHGEWSGWRMSGRFLIAPGPIGRITPETLMRVLREQRNSGLHGMKQSLRA